MPSSKKSYRGEYIKVLFHFSLYNILSCLEWNRGNKVFLYGFKRNMGFKIKESSYQRFGTENSVLVKMTDGT